MKLRSRLLLSAALVALSASSAGAQSLDTGFPFTPTLSNALYASGNSLGGLQNVGFLQPTQAGTFDNFWISSKSGATVAMTVYIFDTIPSASTTCSNNSAFVLNRADISKLAMAPFVVTPALIGAGSTATFSQVTQTVSIRNQDVPIKNSLYICLVANASVTPPATDDLTGKISVALSGQ